MHYMNDYYELAMLLCGFDPDDSDQFDAAEDQIDKILYDKYGVDEEQFERIARGLMPFAHIAKSPLTETIFMGFANHKKGLWLVKQEVNPKPVDKKKKAAVKAKK